jgi:hypothetical protein
MPTDEEIRETIANPERVMNLHLDEIIRDAHALQMQGRDVDPKPMFTLTDAHRMTADTPPLEYSVAGSGGTVKLDPKFEAGLVAGYAGGYAAARKELSDRTEKLYDRFNVDPGGDYSESQLNADLAAALEDFITPEEEESSDELGGEGG